MIKSLTQTFDGLSRNAKIGLGATAVSVVLGAAWVLWPDRHGTLEEWNPDYMDYCYSAAEESEFNTRNRVRRDVSDTLRTVERLGPIGERAFNTVAANDRVICYGDRPTLESAAISFNRWVGVYFVEDRVPNVDVAAYLFRSELSGFGNDASVREDEYITEHAVLWVRAREAMRQVSLLDGHYQIYSDFTRGTGDAFETEQWRAFEGNDNTAAASLAYRDYVQNGGTAIQYNLSGARLAAFNAVLSDHDAIYDIDLNFLQWYKERVNAQTRIESYPCGESTCMRPVTDYPARWVHSQELDPNTLVGLAEVFFPGQGFIEPEDAFDILNNRDNFRPTSSRTQSMYNLALRNAERHCRGHYSEGDMEFGTGLNVNMLPENSRLIPR
jgi:hypothetical protein